MYDYNKVIKIKFFNNHKDRSNQTHTWKINKTQTSNENKFILDSALKSNILNNVPEDGDCGIHTLVAFLNDKRIKVNLNDIKILIGTY